MFRFDPGISPSCNVSDEVFTSPIAIGNETFKSTKSVSSPFGFYRYMYMFEVDGIRFSSRVLGLT